MKYEQYTSLIEKLEIYAKENPKGYEIRVAALAALGYLYFLGLLGAFLIFPVFALLALFFFPKIIFIFIKFAGKLIWLVLIGLASVAGLIWSFIKSLFYKIPNPEGYEINREAVPKLFEMVDKICGFLKSPRPQHILLTQDFNAAVITLPRFGLLGKRVFLIIGLPLMQAVSTKQFEAIIAHELGHISKKHNSYATWIYRLHETWGRFLQSQEAEGHKLSFLYEKFLNWYFPYFRAYSFVLCRRHEREADEFAVQLIGSKALGESLINLEVKSRKLSQSFWKDVLNEAGREKAPPKEIFTRMALAFRETNKSQDLMNLSKALAINTDYGDSHPSLSERLKTIGYWKNSDLPVLPEEVKETASELLLGDYEQKIAVVFNQEWEERVKEEWRERHEYLLESAKKITELNEKAKKEALSADELYEKAGFTSEVYGEKESLVLLRELVELYPEHANAQFAIGMVLLNEDDEKGIEAIKKAMNLDRTLKISGCETIYYYLRGKGRDEEAKNYVLTIEEEEQILGLANNERENIQPTDEFDSHGLSPLMVDNICNKLKNYDEIQAMYLTRKVVRYYTEVPFYVLFLETKKKGWFGNGNVLKSEELLKIAVEGVSEFGIHYFVILEKNFADLKPRLERIENAKIYQR